MTLEAFQDLVKRVTYKPDFLIQVQVPMSIPTPELHSISDEWVNLILRHYVPDVHNPRQRIEVNFQETFTKHEIRAWSPEYAVLKIKDAIQRMEMHEMAEWFKVDGKLQMDPHPERK